MIYSILLLLLLSLFLIGRNYRNRYSWLFACMLLGLSLAFFGLILNTVRVGNYQYPAHVLYELDYQFYIYMSYWKVNYYDTIRMQQIGIALYLISIPLFILEWIRGRKRSKGDKWIWLGVLSLLPVWYIWFYEPETRYSIYVWLHEHEADRSWMEQLLKVIDLINLTWIALYLFYPLRLMYRHFRSSRIAFRRRQMVALGISLLLMNGLFVSIFIISPNNQMFLFTNGEQLLTFSSRPIPTFYYQAFPLLLLLVVQVMAVILIRYKGLDATMLFRSRLINRNVQSLNRNLKGVFHSFKNTMFTVKILSEQASQTYGEEAGLKAIERIKVVSDASLAQLSKVIEAIREIKVHPSRTSLVQVVEEAIEQAGIDESITIERYYTNYDAYSYIDVYHFTQALINLLNNAAEAIQIANRPQGVIEVKIEMEYDWAAISIRDNGTGVGKKTKRHMFHLFYSSKSKHENWGVGLSYVYRIMKAHLGFVSVDSDGESYTVMNVILPVDPLQNSTN